MSDRKASKTIDVVIPLFYGLGYLGRTLQSLISQRDKVNGRMRIIVVDDSGDPIFHDLLLKFIKRKGWNQEVILKNHYWNKGFIEACYTGIEHGVSDYKLILNSDTFLLPGSIQSMIDLAQSSEKIALVNPVTNNIAVIDVEVPNSLNILDMQSELNNFETTQNDFIDIVTSVGFCLLVKSKCIEELGFWDRIFGKGYGEDTDLHFRYVNNGYRAVLDSSSFVYHRGEGSFDDRNEKMVNAREIVFDRFQDLYDETIGEFNEKTVLHDIRTEILNNKGSSAQVVFITKNNSLSDPFHRLSHYLVNTLIMSGISSIVLHKDTVVEESYIDDRYYRSTQIGDYNGFDVEKRLIVNTDRSLYRDAVKVQFESYGSVDKLPSLVYLNLHDTQVNLDDGLYDDVLNFNQSDNLNIFDLNLLSNINIRSDETQKDMVLFSLDTPFDKMLSIAELLRLNIGDKIILYKYGDDLKSIKLGDVIVKIKPWAQTQEFFNDLKKTLLHIDYGGNLYQVITAIISGIPVYSESISHDLEFDGFRRYDQLDPNSVVNLIKNRLDKREKISVDERVLERSEIMNIYEINKIFTDMINRDISLNVDNITKRFNKYIKGDKI